jgi:replicative DNA helicase
MTWAIKNILDGGAAIDYAAGMIGVDMNPLSTGITSWDASCVETGGAGLANWWFTIIGGASNSGKTQLLQHLMRQATEQGMNPGLITMEVPMTGIQRSLYSRITDFRYADLTPHTFEDRDAPDRVKHLVDQVRDYAGGTRSLLVAEHDGSPDLGQIKDMCYAMKEAGCGVIGLDHLQLIKSPVGEVAERATEIAEQLRRFAHKERILVLALSQLNRIASRERDRRPICQDLWGGTSMESNANQVILIDHTHMIRDMKYTHIVRTRLILDKNREGPNRVVMDVEANFGNGVWREALPHEENLWKD